MGSTRYGTRNSIRRASATAADALASAGISYDAGNDRLMVDAKNLLINASATGGSASSGELAIGCSDGTYGRTYRIQHSSSASRNDFMNYSSASGTSEDSLSGTQLSRLNLNSSGVFGLYGVLDMNDNKITCLGDGVADDDAAAIGQIPE